MGYKAPISTRATGSENDANQYRAKPKNVEPRTKFPGEFQPRRPAEEE
jgi:hypothetical protein